MANNNSDLELNRPGNRETGARTFARPAGTRPAGSRPTGTRPAGSRPTTADGTTRRPAGAGQTRRPASTDGTTRRPVSTDGAVNRRPATADGTTRRPAGAGQTRRPASTDGIARRPASSDGAVKRRPSSADGVTRRPASTDGTTRRPASTDGTTRRPASAGTTRRPSSTSGATRRPSSANGATRRPASGSGVSRNSGIAASNRRPSSRGTSANGRRQGQNTNRRPAVNEGGILAKLKQLPLYWICLAAYSLILIICGAIFLSYTNKCLIQYENSQSDNAMTGIMEDYKKMVKDGSLANKIEMPSASEFEGKDVFTNMYMGLYEGVKKYTYEKDKNSYLTESPMYDIYADGNFIAKITLKATNQHTVFGILTIMDWGIDKIEPVFSAGTQDYLISIPDGYTVRVNDIEVTDEYKTGNTYMNPDYANAAEYVDMPMTVEYKIVGFANKPEIKVYGKDGTEVACNVDAKGNVSLGASGSAADMPQERKDDAYKMAKTWEDFLTNDLSGDGQHGLTTVQQYLIKDSYYWKLASDYAVGPDITFISDHTLLDPGYSDLVIDNYVVYSDNCYSCHVKFNKNMLLTRTGESRVDAFDSILYFVYYDDTDDGVDNPHWAIADMVAVTEEEPTEGDEV